MSDTLDQPIIRDTIKPTQPKKYEVAKNGFDSEIIYGSIDSNRYDNKMKEMHLYGDAFVTYENKELKADYIILQMETNIAEARISKVKKNSIKPTFKDGDKIYKYNTLKYNFETEKGYVENAITQEGEFQIHGERTKFVSAKNDSLFGNDVIYNANSIITTCDHDHPHFGFRAKKLKVVSEKVAVFGPSNLELGGVPTPIWIPFGVYPLVEGTSSGFIFPQNYEFNSRQLGFGLQGFGWYFPINDYVHMKLTADYYTRGSFGLYLNTTYNKKYKYSGRLDISYNNRITEVTDSPDPISAKGYAIRFNHSQDSKAHPFINVGGSINIIANDNQRRINNDVSSVLTSTYTSNFFYRHSMPRSPFSFKLGLSHNQNTNSGVVNITLPDVQLNMNTIYPFERKNRGGNEEAWYEKIAFDYDAKMKSFVQTTDSTMFSQEMYDDIKTGLNQQVSTGFSSRVFKHFNFVVNANYDETWVLNTIDRDIIQIPTVDSFKDTLITNTNAGFESFRTYGASVGLNTQLFATATFKKGKIRGIRHTLKPSIGFRYAPNTRDIYRDTIYYTDLERAPEIYTRFDQGPFNSPSFSDLQSQLTYAFNSVLELKLWSKKDSTEKKVRLFDNLNVSGNYNFAADSLKWSRININSTTRLFKGATTLTTRWSFDPYMEDGNSSVNKLLWKENKKIARLESGQIRLSNRLTVKKIREAIFGGKSKDKTQESKAFGPFDESQLETKLESNNDSPFTNANDPQKRVGPELITFESILDNITIDHNIVYTFTGNNNIVNAKLQTHSLGISGTIPLTDKWKISVGNFGYDFVQNGPTYARVTFTRSLHCWDMNFSWSPSIDTYSFSIGVRSSALSFLKYNYGQNNVDGLIGRF
ncbi:MAG: LPS-assembly protein LptD [Saprospiraceae bacterium]|nr:hypothetical protein [Bacteroidia bacterium]NNL93119.1 LPS-assembly protein LptD [Saprospiraceae bacterium]